MGWQPDPPATPDYTGAAQAQGQANLDATRAGARLNNPNVISPYGNQTTTWGKTFNQSGYDEAQANYAKERGAFDNAWSQWNARGKNGPFDMVAPKAINRSDFEQDAPTITQTLSPDQQKIYDKGNQVKIGMSDLANQGVGIAKNVLGQQMDMGSLPGRPGSAEDTRTKVMNAMMSRVNEDVDRQKETSNSNLLAAGIPTGSKAYQDAQALNERTRTDARNQALLASGQEMSRDFQTDSARRRDALGEMLTERQTPLNEITALMSGNQINNPFSMPGYSQNNQVSAAPLFAAQNAAADYNTDLYNVKAAQAGNMQQGLFGLANTALGGGMMMMGGKR